MSRCSLPSSGQPELLFPRLLISLYEGCSASFFPKLKSQKGRGQEVVPRVMFFDSTEWKELHIHQEGVVEPTAQSLSPLLC